MRDRAPNICWKCLFLVSRDPEPIRLGRLALKNTTGDTRTSSAQAEPCWDGARRAGRTLRIGEHVIAVYEKTGRMTPVGSKQRIAVDRLAAIRVAPEAAGVEFIEQMQPRRPTSG